MNEYAPLVRVALGVGLAAALYAFKRWREVDHYTLWQEFKGLVIPALLLGPASLFAGASYLDAAATTLTALGIALGLNSKALTPPPKV